MSSSNLDVGINMFRSLSIGSSETISKDNNFDQMGEQSSDAHFRRNLSSGKLPQESKPEGRVLVLYTGGTIGMVRNSEGALVPKADAFVKSLRSYPNLHDKQYAEERFGPMGPLVLPYVSLKMVLNDKAVGCRTTDIDNRRVIYNVLEYSPLCDSSNMTMEDWMRIAHDIKESYEHFDGFVILHGTDTLSYTASALSFMLESLGKIVILTGSQLSLFDTRSDGLDNFLTSLVIAANYNIPEVCVFFGTRLMRGNRTTKSSVTAFEAFHSPNAPPLAVAGIQIEVDYTSIFRSCNMEKFSVHAKLNQNVGLLRLFPSITANLVRSFMCEPIEGVILQTYGAGNVPSNREDIIAEFRAAAARGVIIVNITQCNEGSVSSIYDTGKILVEAGVISGFDMTPEAALTKLAYVLSKSEWDIETKRAMMETSLRGELSHGRSSSMQDWELLDAVGRSLHLSSPREFKQLGSVLFPAMMNAAVLARDTVKLSSLKRYGADISQANADGRTALHVACCEGELVVVRHLLELGANVHVKDRFNRSPLTDAIEYDRHQIIRLLMQCGAHLHEHGRQIGERLCAAAAAGSLARLQSYHAAGADLSQCDVSGRTALHLACLHGHVALVRFLLEHGAEVRAHDFTAKTPLDYANDPACRALLLDCVQPPRSSTPSLENGPTYPQRC